MQNKLCIHCFISGRVQGVWFRAHAKEVADQLGVSGFAKNLGDGRVEVIACGDREKLTNLYEWLQQGPPLAKVDEATYEELDWHEYNGFMTL